MNTTPEYWTPECGWFFKAGDTVRDAEGDIYKVIRADIAWGLTAPPKPLAHALDLETTEGGIKKLFGVNAKHFHKFERTRS